jgi:GNAT superfamily N-acetyltransferase
MNTIITPTPVCRPALPMDKPQMLELTKRIWDGEDYLPYVWDEWLADSEGVLAVTELAGQIVGIGKLTRLTSDQWWLEGLRTHPDFEGRGLASHLTDYLLAAWQHAGGNVIRLTTASFRVPVHRLSEKRGFVKIGEYSFFRANSLAESTAHFQLIQLDEILAANELAQQSTSRTMFGRFSDLGWRWAETCLPLLETAIQTGKAWWWQEKCGVLTWWEDNEENDTKPCLSLLACEPHSLPDFLIDARRLAANKGYTQIAWNAPLTAGVIEALQLSGFRRTWEDSLYLYEKKAP